MNTNQRQQGDVLFHKVSSVPGGARKVKHHNGKYVLAEGEVTGHAHVVPQQECELYEKDGVLFMSVPKSATVTHEEHHPVTIDDGVWEVAGVVEVDPFEDETRRVAD